jgi:flagellar biosynthetic protein FliQ
MSTTLDLWREALITMAVVAAPFLIAGLVVGLAVALFQTATQLQESVLAFVPKLVAALVVLALGGHFVLDRLTHFASHAITRAAEPNAERVGGGPTP